MLGAKLMVCGTIHSFQQLTSLKFESTGKKKPRRVRVDTLDVGFTVKVQDLETQQVLITRDYQGHVVLEGTKTRDPLGLVLADALKRLAADVELQRLVNDARIAKTRAQAEGGAR